MAAVAVHRVLPAMPPHQPLQLAPQLSRLQPRAMYSATIRESDSAHEMLDDLFAFDASKAMTGNAKYVPMARRPFPKSFFVPPPPKTEIKAEPGAAGAAIRDTRAPKQTYTKKPPCSIRAKKSRSKSVSVLPCRTQTQTFKPIRPTPKTPNHKHHHRHIHTHRASPGAPSRSLIPTMPFKPTKKRSAAHLDEQYRGAVNITSLDTKFRLHMDPSYGSNPAAGGLTDVVNTARFVSQPSPVFSDGALSDDYGSEGRSAWGTHIPHGHDGDHDPLASGRQSVASVASDHSTVFDGILGSTSSPTFDAESYDMPSWELRQIDSTIDDGRGFGRARAESCPELGSFFEMLPGPPGVDESTPVIPEEMDSSPYLSGGFLSR